MKKPSDDQIAMADQAGPASSVARELGGTGCAAIAPSALRSATMTSCLLEARSTRGLGPFGAQVTLASIKKDPIQGVVHDSDDGETITPDLTLGEVEPDDYDALLIPGGVGNPDTMRMEQDALAIVRAFFAADKPVAAICHGPWLLAEADVIDGRTVTSWPSIRTDLRNAGAEVVDKEVQVDGKLITSRKPDDIPAFTEALIKSIEQD